MEFYLCFYFGFDSKSCSKDYGFRLFLFRSAADRFLSSHPYFSLSVLKLNFML